MAPAEDGQADQLMEMEPKDCGEAVLFTVGEGGKDSMDFEHVNSSIDEGGTEQRPHRGSGRLAAAGPEVVFRPEPPGVHGARQGLGTRDQGGHHNREDGHQLPEPSWMEQLGEGEDMLRIAIGEPGKRGQGCPEFIGGTGRRETARGGTGHGTGNA